MKSETGILKWPLIIAAIVVVVRVICERMGVPETVNNLLSIAAMHTVIVPVYIAIQLGRRNAARPFFSLFLQIAVFAVVTRIMILPTYWAGRIFEWTNSRFDGTWGPGVTPFAGFVGVPLLTAASWIVASIVIGGLLGTIVLAVTRKLAK